MEKINKEDFFSFGDVCKCDWKHTCDVCGREILNEKFKGNHAFRRVESSNCCVDCFDNGDLEKYIDKKFEKMKEEILGYAKKFEKVKIMAIVQDCDRMQERTIRKRISDVVKGDDWFRVYYPLVERQDGFKMYYHKYTVGNYRYRNGGGSDYSIIFDVDDYEDFKKKWGILNRAKTNCGSSLFYGDGCHAEASMINKDGIRDIKFELLP
jgi:hypothetical protein